MRRPRSLDSNPRPRSKTRPPGAPTTSCRSCASGVEHRRIEHLPRETRILSDSESNITCDKFLVALTTVMTHETSPARPGLMSGRPPGIVTIFCIWALLGSPMELYGWFPPDAGQVWRKITCVKISGLRGGAGGAVAEKRRQSHLGFGRGEGAHGPNNFLFLFSFVSIKALHIYQH